MTEENFPIHAGGRLWTVDRVSLATLPDGTVALSAPESERIHRAIANAICGEPGQLTSDELEFLCDVTSATYAEVARAHGYDRSTVTQWRKKGVVSSWVVSNALRKWFWFRLFGDELGEKQFPLSVLGDDATFLRSASGWAIEARATEHVELRQAS